MVAKSARVAGVETYKSKARSEEGRGPTKEEGYTRRDAHRQRTVQDGR